MQKQKGTKRKKIRSISTSTDANELVILPELASLMTSDLNSIRKNKCTDFTNREAAASWRGL